MSDDNPKVYKAKLKDFKPDPKNANRHTERGRWMVENSMSKRGYARPAFAANDGTVLGGNLSTMEVAGAIDLGDGEVLVIETDGRLPIIHKRTDIEPGSDEARLLALEDNRTGEVSLDFDIDQILAEMDAGLDLSELWFDGELEEMAAADQMTGMSDASSGEGRSLGDARHKIKPVLYAEDIETFERAIRTTGLKNRGQALIEICKVYLGEKGQYDLSLEEIVTP